MKNKKKSESEQAAPCPATQAVNTALEALEGGMKVKRAARDSARKVIETLSHTTEPVLITSEK